MPHFIARIAPTRKATETSEGGEMVIGHTRYPVFEGGVTTVDHTQYPSRAAAEAAARERYGGDGWVIVEATDPARAALRAAGAPDPPDVP